MDGIEANKLEIESTIEESDYTSIKATVKAKGNGLKYSYSLDDKTYTDQIESNTHTFTGLKPNKRYTVYYKVEDKDGNYETESKWIETKHDSMPPECTLEVKEITLENIKIKATCTDETEIVKYELSESGSLYKDKGTTSEYNIDNFYLSKIKIRVIDLANNNKEYKLTDEQLNAAYQELTALLNNRYQKVLNRQSSVESNLLNKTYPVGSIYISTKYSTASEVDNTIGGDWETYGTGRTLVGVNASDTNFNIVGKTGGTSTTTLAVANMPAHTHSVPKLSGTAASAGAHSHNVNFYHGQPGYNQTIPTYTHYFLWGETVSYTDTALTNRNVVTGWTTNTVSTHTHTVSTVAKASGSNGSASSFTNLQPYITVYMYKRKG